MDWMDVVEKINERFVKIAKSIAKKYNLSCKVFNLEKYYDSCHQRIKVLYKYSDGYITEAPVEIIYEYIKDDKILIKVNREKVSCRKVDNFSEKALNKIEDKISQKIENIVKDFIKSCEEYEKELAIKRKIANTLENIIGLRPSELYYVNPNFMANFSRSNEKEKIELSIRGKTNGNEIKVTEITIYDSVGQRLPYFLEQIFQIFNN